MALIKYKHNSDKLYKLQAAEFENKDVDFFSCYKNKYKDCVDCESTFKSTFLNLLSKINTHQNWNFMDCGSGLGFPLYLASSYFKKVYGVEIIEDIANISKKNLTELNIRNFEIINSDINRIDIDILDKINVFYMFNPFKNKIFEEFINNIIKSIKNNNREVWLIYVNTVCEKVLDKDIVKDVLPLAFSINDFRKINFYHHNNLGE